MEYMQSRGIRFEGNEDVEWHEQFHTHYGDRLSYREKEELVEDFNTSAAFARLKPYRDAVDGMKRLRSLGYRIHVVTACGTHPKTKIARWVNLCDVFGDDMFKSFYCVGLGESKAKPLSIWENSGHFFVDDSVRNLKTAKELGLTPVLMEDEWNVGSSWDGLRISTWQEFHTLLPQTR